MPAVAAIIFAAAVDMVLSSSFDRCAQMMLLAIATALSLRYACYAALRCFRLLHAMLLPRRFDMAYY